MNERSFYTPGRFIINFDCEFFYVLNNLLESFRIFNSIKRTSTLTLVLIENSEY